MGGERVVVLDLADVTTISRMRVSLFAAAAAALLLPCLGINTQLNITGQGGVTLSLPFSASGNPADVVAAWRAQLATPPSLEDELVVLNAVRQWSITCLQDAREPVPAALQRHMPVPDLSNYLAPRLEPMLPFSRCLDAGFVSHSGGFWNGNVLGEIRFVAHTGPMRPCRLSIVLFHFAKRRCTVGNQHCVDRWRQHWRGCARVSDSVSSGAHGHL